MRLLSFLFAVPGNGDGKNMFMGQREITTAVTLPSLPLTLVVCLHQNFIPVSSALSMKPKAPHS